MKFLAGVFASPSRFERAQKLGRLGQRFFMTGGVIEHLPGPLGGWTAMRDVYPVAPQTFREWWRTALMSRRPRRPRSSAASARPSATSPRPRRPTTSPVARDYRRPIDRPATSTGSSSSSTASPSTRRRSAGSRPPDLPAAIAAACAARGVRRLVVPADLPDGWLPAGVELLRDPGLTDDQLDAERRRADRPAPWGSPRPGRSSSTAARARAGGRSRSCPTITSASSATTRSSASSPRPSPASRRRRRAPAGRSPGSPARRPRPTSS